MTYACIPIALKWDCSEYTIRHSLRRHGFKRYVALRKPPITEKTRILREALADKRRFWGPEKWQTILWSDETWVTSGRHRKTYVTRRMDEALDPTRIVDRV